MTPRRSAPAGSLIYVRKSTVEAERRSLEEQEADARALASRLGLPVQVVLREEASAYAERERPRFTEALRLAEERGLVILAWSIDRFSRKGAEAVIPLLPRKGAAAVRLVTCDGDDTADPEKRLLIILKAEMALQESERIGRRVTRARAAARAAGAWAGGNATFGYRIVGSGRSRRLEVDPEAAAVIHQMAEAVLAGTPVRTVAARLNAAGVRAPRAASGNWSHVSVKRALMTPALAGWLPHNGDVVRDAEGAPVVAHEAILSPDTWERLQARLRALGGRRDDGSRTSGGRPPSTLLAGLLVCPCGYRMGADRSTGHYRCGGPRGDGRVHTTAKLQAVEDAVSLMVLRRLAALAADDPDAPEVVAVAEAWAGLTGQAGDASERRVRADAVEAAQERLRRTARMVAEGILDHEDAAPMLADYRTALRAAEARAAELGPSTADVSFLMDLAQSAANPEGSPIGPGSAWAALDLSTQRAVLQAVLLGVDVAPADQGARDVEARLSPRWRGAEADS
jgi:DNA invertase Pin-like site-specific DNA recombinase